MMGGMAVSPVLAGSLGIKTMLIWYGALAFAALIIFFVFYRFSNGLFQSRIGRQTTWPPVATF